MSRFDEYIRGRMNYWQLYTRQLDSFAVVFCHFCDVSTYNLIRYPLSQASADPTSNVYTYRDPSFLDQFQTLMPMFWAPGECPMKLPKVTMADLQREMILFELMERTMSQIFIALLLVISTSIKISLHFWVKLMSSMKKEHI